MKEYVRFNIEYVNDRLKYMGLSKAKFMNMAEISKSSFYAWFRGNGYVFPRADTMYYMSKILKCDINDLLVVEKGIYTRTN